MTTVIIAMKTIIQMEFHDWIFIIALMAVKKMMYVVLTMAIDDGHD